MQPVCRPGRAGRTPRENTPVRSRWGERKERECEGEKKQACEMKIQGFRLKIQDVCLLRANKTEQFICYSSANNYRSVPNGFRPGYKFIHSQY